MFIFKIFTFIFLLQSFFLYATDCKQAFQDKQNKQSLIFTDVNIRNLMIKNSNTQLHYFSLAVPLMFVELNVLDSFDQFNPVIKNLAQQEDAEAQYLLGFINFKFLENYQMALHWWNLAAQQGHKQAQSNLGLLKLKSIISNNHDYAEWIPINKVKPLIVSSSLNKIHTRKWWESNMDKQTSSKWKSYIFDSHQEPEVIIQNYIQFIKQNPNLDNNNLSVEFIISKNNPKVSEEAFELWQQSQKQVSSSKHNLANWYALNQDYKSAISLWKQASKLGHVESHITLGILYYHGLFGISKNHSRAKKYFKKAAQKNHIEGQYNLMIMNHDGKKDLYETQEGKDFLKMIQDPS